MAPVHQSQTEDAYAPVPLTIVTRLTPKKDQKPPLPRGSGLYWRGDIIHWRMMIDGVEYTKSTEESTVRRALRKATEFATRARDKENGWEQVTVPTLRAFYTEYCKTLPPTRSQEAAKMVPFVERYGDRRMDTFTQHEAESWLKERLNPALHTTQAGKPRKPGTVHNEGSVLRTMFSNAKLQKLLKENPWKVGKRQGGISVPAPSVRTRVLKRGHEQDRFFDALDRVHRRAVMFILGTGCRLEEFTLLVPNDITRLANGRGLLHIRAEIAKYSHARTIPLGTTLLQILDEQLAWRGIDPHSTTDPLFLYTCREFEKIIGKAVTDAGITHLTPHDLRRTYGTRMASHVRNPKHLQKLMGHKSIQTTMEHYVQIEDEELDLAAAGADLGLDPITRHKVGCCVLCGSPVASTRTESVTTTQNAGND